MASAAAAMYLVAMSLWSLPHPRFQGSAIIVAVALFPLRRRFPGAVLLALGAVTGMAPVAGPVMAATAYTVALGAAPPRRRIQLLGGAGLLVVASATATGPRLGTGSALYGLAMGLVLVATAVVVPGLAGTVQGQQGRLLRALRDRADTAERARLLADSEARTHERSRIAAEMHDLLGHRLSLISLHAGALELGVEEAAPGLREEAVLVRRTTREAMRELRQTLGVLGPLGRDTGPDVLTDATGSRADIESLVTESREGGIAVELDWTGADLGARPAGVRRAVHRVVRESLTNVHRYAPSAHVTVSVVHDRTSVRVRVRNGAPALAPPPSSPLGPPLAPASTSSPAPQPAASGIGTGRGLMGLRERVELLGGTFQAASLPTGGFQVVAVVPAEPDDIVPGERPAGPAGGPAPQVTDAQRRVDDPAAAAPGRRTAGALTFALVAGALWVLMVLGTALVYAGQPDRPAPARTPRLGMTYQELRGVIDNPVVRAAATGHEPPRPDGTVGCVYPVTGTESRPGALSVTRYCFAASQRLIAIDRFTVPSLRDAAPWETTP